MEQVRRALNDVRRSRLALQQQLHLAGLHRLHSHHCGSGRKGEQRQRQGCESVIKVCRRRRITPFRQIL